MCLILQSFNGQTNAYQNNMEILIYILNILMTTTYEIRCNVIIYMLIHQTYIHFTYLYTARRRMTHSWKHKHLIVCHIRHVNCFNRNILGYLNDNCCSIINCKVQSKINAVIFQY